MNKVIPTDALITAEDVMNIKAEIDRGNFKRMVYELVIREPELAIALAQQFDLVTTLLQGAAMSIKQRAVVEKQLTLLVWTPVLLLDRGHRRSWDDFLPSEDAAADEPGEEGGGE
jgi:hypothetical protein